MTATLHDYFFAKMLQVAIEQKKEREKEIS